MSISPLFRWPNSVNHFSIVIENNSGWKKGKIYVEAQTINDIQILESEGLILHDHIDILINRDKFMTEAKKND
ncbi:hypothetical protein [Klebsiella pneumoniae ISC21]|nr:hypothetical protein [Klebsiella pneumoniae ISC21]